MSQQTPNGSSRPKKSKLEKIAELESSLKIAKEENRRLKKEVHMLKNVGGAPLSPRASGSTTPAANLGEAEKMKDALKALKRVTINQEMSLQSLRAKASQRRQELEARDSTINKLHRQIASLKRNSSGDGNTRRLQDALMDEEAKNVELTELLEATESKVGALEKQLANKKRSGPFQRENSNGSMKSVDASVSTGSVSTAQEFDVAKLKKELAKKSSRIVQLEYELEMTKDQLHEMKRRQKGSAAAEAAGDGFEADFNDGFDNPFGNNNNNDDFYSETGGDDEDEWF